MFEAAVSAAWWPPHCLTFLLFCSPPRSEPKWQPFCLLGLFGVAVGAWRCDPIPCAHACGAEDYDRLDIGHCIIASSPANSSGLKSTSIKVRFCIVLKYMYQLLPGTCSRRQININSSTLCFYGLRYVDAFVANTLIEARSLMLQCCGRALAEG